ncbi:WG repeat-containing protein [Clostridium sp. DL1XJH146]
MTINKRAKKTIILILIIFSIVAVRSVTNANNDKITEENVTVEDNELYSICFKGNVYGYANKNGEVVIEPKYETVTQFYDGVACVREFNDNNYLIDEEGNIISSIDGWVYLVKDGLWYIEKDNKYGCIDKYGKWVIEPKFDYLSLFEEGLAEAGINGKYGKHGFVNENGKWIIEPKFDDVFQFYDDLAAASLNGKFGFINKAGDWVIEPKFDSVTCDFSEGLAAANINNKVGYIDKKGDWVIEPKFSSSFDFQDGIALVYYNGKSGFIDKNGEWIIEPKFDSAYQFNNGYAIVSYEKGNDLFECGIINKKGEFIFQDENVYITDNDIENGFFIFKRDGLYGVLNNKGEEVIEPKYIESVNRKNKIIFLDEDTIYFLDENLEIQNEYNIGSERNIIPGYIEEEVNIITRDRILYFSLEGDLIGDFKEDNNYLFDSKY